MNLIEQLGGYKKARERGKRENVLDDHDFNYIQKALLQYRRENGIFEVEDKVVILTLALGNKYLWTVENTDGCMIEVSQLGRPNEWAHFAEISHTTDAEIRAVHRLELEILNDHDIPPNTTILER